MLKHERCSRWAFLASLLAGCLDWNSSKRHDDMDASGEAVDDAVEHTTADQDAAFASLGETTPVDAETIQVLLDSGDALDAHVDDHDSGQADGGAAAEACPAAACPTLFPCSGNAAAYTCLGQFADFPLPLRRAGQSLVEQQLMVDSESGTVVDLVTGLAWQRALYFGLWNYAEAETYCAGLALGGVADFRLPTIHELSSIAGSVQTPDLDTTVFLRVNTNPSYWTSTPDTEAATKSHWTAGSPGDAYDESYPDDNERGVVCVRVQQSHIAEPQTARFRVSQSGDTIRDARTQLVWQADIALARYQQSYSQANSYCASVGADGYAFRLPTVAEALSLWDFSRPSGQRVRPPFSGKPDDVWTMTTVTDGAGPQQLIVQASGQIRQRDSTDTGFFAGTRCVSPPSAHIP